MLEMAAMGALRTTGIQAVKYLFSSHRFAEFADDTPCNTGTIAISLFSLWIKQTLQPREIY